MAAPAHKPEAIARAEYSLLLSGKELDGDTILAKWQEYMAQPEIMAEKRSKKGKINTVDLAPSIKNAEVTDRGIELVLAAGGSDNLNPKLLLEAFEKANNTKLPYATVVRTMLYDAEMNEFK